MKALVIYYSRTGTTRKVAEMIAKELKADILEIVSTQNRDGILALMRSGFEAFSKRLPPIKDIKADFSKYDRILLGTPVWVGTMASPVRTFLTRYKNKFPDVPIAFFCTMGGNVSKAFKQMADVLEKEPRTTFALTTKEVVSDDYLAKLKNFANEIMALKTRVE